MHQVITGLNITKEELDEGFKILERVIYAVVPLYGED
jgi:hypothetical protein